jgi:hypothetical protein
VYGSFYAKNLLGAGDTNVVEARTTVVAETGSNRGSGSESQYPAAPAAVEIQAEDRAPSKNLNQRWLKNCRDCGVIFENRGESGFNDDADLHIRS